MELKQLEQKISILLKNNKIILNHCKELHNISIFYNGYNVPLCEIVIIDFEIVLKAINIGISMDNDIYSLSDVKEAINILILLKDDSILKELKAIIKEYIK